jgi:hypothetical protein
METVNYGRNKFYDTGPMCQCYKTIYCRSLQMFGKVYVPSKPFRPNPLLAIKTGAYPSVLALFANIRQGW